MGQSITQIEYNIDRDSFQADGFEKMSRILLMPDRIFYGRKYRLMDGKFERLPPASTIVKIITLILGVCFFFITVPATLIGSLCANLSKSYNLCVNAHIKFIKDNLKANDWEDKILDESQLHIQALELFLANQRSDLIENEKELETVKTTALNDCMDKINNLFSTTTTLTQLTGNLTQRIQTLEHQFQQFHGNIP
jgi:hypothetical protein